MYIDYNIKININLVNNFYVYIHIVKFIKGGFYKMNVDLVNISRLALTGNDVDLRLFLAKYIRKTKSHDLETANALENLLKENRRESSFLRKAAHGYGTDSQQSEEKRIDENVSTLLKFWDSSSNLEEIYLSSEIRNSLNLIVSERTQNNLKLLSEKNLKPVTTVIFQGPPGVGKTLAAKWLSKHLKLPLYTLDLTTIMSSYMGKTGNNIRKVLDFAKSHPCILFLDEIDAVAKSRSDNSDVGELKRIVTILLQEIENWTETGLLVAATNHVELIDPAIWRRFDLELEFGMPTADNMELAIKKYFAEDLDYFKPWLPLIKLGMSNLSFSLMKRKIMYLRKLKLLNNALSEETILNEVFPDISNMSRQERLDIALSLTGKKYLTQTKAAELFKVSRETLRKYSQKKVFNKESVNG